MSYEWELTRTYEQVGPPKVVHCALKKEEGKFVGDICSAMVFLPLRNSFSGCFAIVFLLWLVVMATAGLWMWEIGNAFLMRGRLYKERRPSLI